MGRFAPKLDQDINGSLCSSRRKRENETYISFTQDLKKLIQNNYSEGWSQSQIERLTREKLFESIEDFNVKALIWAKGPATSKEATHMADGLQQLHKNSKRPDNYQRRQEIETIPALAGPNTRYGRGVWSKENQNTSPVICYACKLPGHIVRNCHSKIQFQPPAPQLLPQRSPMGRRQEN